MTIPQEPVPARKFKPKLEYTRYATEESPEWAILLNQYDTLCECDLLPVMARYVIELELPKNQGIRKIKHQACPACLKLEMADRHQYDKRQANQLFDSLSPPERPNELYALRRLFCGFSAARFESRLNLWVKHGELRLSPTKLKLGNGHFTPAITYVNLIAFLKNPDAWYLWRAIDIVGDPVLRAWNAKVREMWPWHWMTTAEVCRSLGYSPQRVRQFAKMLEAKIGPRPEGKSKGGMNFYFRSDVVAWFQAEVIPHFHMGGKPYSLIYGEPYLDFQISLPLSYRDEIKIIGGNNLSKGVRELLEYWRIQHKGLTNEASGEGRSKPTGDSRGMAQGGL